VSASWNGHLVSYLSFSVSAYKTSKADPTDKYNFSRSLFLPLSGKNEKSTQGSPAKKKPPSLSA
jgi:hypothetical protein